MGHRREKDRGSLAWEWSRVPYVTLWPGLPELLLSQESVSARRSGPESEHRLLCGFDLWTGPLLSCGSFAFHKCVSDVDLLSGNDAASVADVSLTVIDHCKLAWSYPLILFSLWITYSLSESLIREAGVNSGVCLFLNEISDSSGSRVIQCISSRCSVRPYCFSVS